MEVTCELERVLHRRSGGNVVLGVQCLDGTGQGPAKRPDLSIAAALDRSASMKGEKIVELRVATRALIEALLPTDRLVLIALHATADVLAAGAGPEPGAGPPPPPPPPRTRGADNPPPPPPPPRPPPRAQTP